MSSSATSRVSACQEFVTAGGLYSGDKAPVVDLKPRFDVDAVKASTVKVLTLTAVVLVLLSGPWGDGYDPETGDDILSFEVTLGIRGNTWLELKFYIKPVRATILRECSCLVPGLSRDAHPREEEGRLVVPVWIF